MSGNIPDLTTSNVGWIAYYNVVNNTNVTESDLTDGTVEENGDGPAEIETMTNQNNENIDYYDNGVIVTYEGPTRIVTIRFKTDGWITAHMDRTKNYDIQQGDYADIDGVHDIVHWNDDVAYNGSADASESSLVTNTLERSIKTALEQMSIHDTKISSPYDPNDVELYNYEFDSNNATLLSDAKRGGVDGGGTWNYKFQYTDATQVEYVVIAVSHAGTDETISQTGSNKTIVNPYQDAEWGAINATDKFKNLSSGQPYELTVDLGYDSADRECSLHVVVVWS